MVLRELKYGVMAKEVKNEPTQRFIQIEKRKSQKESAIAQLRKRSKDSKARPKAEKNILSKKDATDMTKLCARGKAAAKRKFAVYPVHTRTHMLVKFVRVK